MFCGLPVKVTTLPMLEEVANAMRKGTGLSFVWFKASIRSGVNIKQIVSFTKSADRMPLEKETKHNKRKEFLAWVINKYERYLKQFAILR